MPILTITGISFGSALLALMWVSAVDVAAARERRAVKIVGIGAVSCVEFVGDARRSPQILRDYLAWMQGDMSGILIGRPEGVDEGIDLNSQMIPLPKQLEFVRNFCLQWPSASFSDAAEALYKKLRVLSGG